MSVHQKPVGVAAALTGTGPVGAGVRALAVFLLLYVLASAVPASRTTAGVKVIGAALSFALLSVSLYRLLRARAEQREETDIYTLSHDSMSPGGRAADEVEPDHRVATPAQPLEAVGQAALERAAIALYQFNGLSSQTVAVGSAGAYRIRLTPRGAAQAIALLQCAAGAERQGTDAYQALLQAMHEEGVAKAFFVAPAGFLPDVVAQARAQHVTLVDAKLFGAMIDRLPEGAKSAVSSLLR